MLRAKTGLKAAQPKTVLAQSLKAKKCSRAHEELSAFVELASSNYFATLTAFCFPS
jgi:hypothetical protein